MNWWYLISEDGNTISLGRTSFWILFGIAIAYWFRYEIKDFPPTLTLMLECNLAYNFGKKGLETITSAVNTVVASKATK